MLAALGRALRPTLAMWLPSHQCTLNWKMMVHSYGIQTSVYVCTASPPLSYQPACLSYSKAPIRADIVKAEVVVMFVTGGCQPSSIGSRSFSNRYLISVALPLPLAGSPNADRINEYSSIDGVAPNVALNSGFVARPY